MNPTRMSRWFGLEQLESRQHLATVTWDGGGSDGNWNNPLNWSADVLPTMQDDVVIADANTPLVRVSQGFAGARTLTSHNAMRVEGGTLFVQLNWLQQADLTIAGGMTIADGDLTLGGNTVWTGGTLGGGTGALTEIAAGHSFLIDGNVSLDRELDNDGTLEWRSGNMLISGSLILLPMTPRPAINNRTGGLFLVKSSGTISSLQSTFIVNAGTMRVDVGAGATTTIAVPFDNQPEIALGVELVGTVDVRSGTLAFTLDVAQRIGDSLRGGAWLVSSSNSRITMPGPDILFVGGRVVLNGSASAFPIIEHAVSFEDLTLSGGRAFTITPSNPELASISHLTINNPGMLTTIPRLRGEELRILGGRVDIDRLEGHAIRLDAGTVLVLTGLARLPYADVSGAGLIRVKGELEWPSGTIAGPGQLVITETGHLNMTGQYYEIGDKTLTRRIINRGVMDWHAGISDSIRFSTEVVNRGTWNLDINGYLSTTSDIGPGYTPAYITNYGLINSYANVTVRAAGGAVRLYTAGTIRAVAGSLVFNGGAYGSGTWVSEAGAELVFGGFGTILSNPVFLGAGRIREAARAIWLNPQMSGAGELVVTPPANLTLFGGGTSITRSTFWNDGLVSMGLASTATVYGNLVNKGTLAVDAGTLNIHGDFGMTSAATLRVTSTSIFPHLRVNVFGQSDLSGRLVAVFLWTPPPNAVFDFMFTSFHTGTFTQVEGIGIPVGAPVIQFLGSYLRLKVVVA